MAQEIIEPPTPVANQAGFDRWIFRLWKRLVSEGQIAWDQLILSGANLIDIGTRNHADLQNINTATYTHLSATNATDLTDGGATTLHKHDHAGQDNLNSTSYYHLTQAERDKLLAYGVFGVFNGTATRTQSGVVTDATLIPASGVGSVTLPAGFFSRIGKQLHVRLCGLYTTDAAPGNATLTLKFGSTTYATTGSFALDGSVTDRIWWWEGYITCRSTGATGTLSGNCAWLHSENNATHTLHTEDAAVTSPVTIDTTVSQTLDVQLTTDDAGTSFSCTCCTLWENF